jgi:hypothetical protein
MGSSTKTKETSNNIQKVELPAWMTQAGQDLYSNAKATADLNPVQAYAGQIAPNLQANQAAAGQQASAGQNTGQREQNAASALTVGAAAGGVPDIQGGTFGNEQAQQYMNPYIQQVQERTVMDMLKNNKREIDGLGDQAAAGKAFGGTRHAVLEAQTRGNQQENLLDYLAGSNAQAYSDAQGQFERDRQARLGAETTNNANRQAILDRMLAAGGQMSNIGATRAGLQSQSIMDLLRTGGVQQETERDQLGAAYNEFLRMQDAPMERYRDLASILSGVPRNVTTTSNGTATSKTSGGLMNTLLGVGQLGVAAYGAGMFSDRRLKRDIVRIGSIGDIPLYAYRYLWDRVRRIGVMADEVPVHALGPRVFGFQTVNYQALGGAA